MKSHRPLWKISVTTSREAEDAVAELLGSTTGCSAASYFNLETGVSVTSVFTEKKIPAHVRTDVMTGLKRIRRCGLNIGAGKIEIVRIKREDWAESWKKHFKEIEIGAALLIKPSWIRRRAVRGQRVIILDPGLSFGTGQHPTTSFCLHQIVAAAGKLPQISGKLEDAKSFLDIGTGSGILAIAAAKLGYQPVRAFDFDPESVRVAKTNMRVNRVEGKIQIARGDVSKLPAKSPRKFDLVCANLISNLLVAEKKRIVGQVNPGGTLVLAGILGAEFLQVQRAFESLGMKLMESKVENEWRSGSFCFA